MESSIALLLFPLSRLLSSQANQYASNGILHTINMSVNALENCWEFIAGNAAAPLETTQFLAVPF